MRTAPEREQALAAFYDRYRGNALVIDKWFTTQALSTRDDTPERGRGAGAPSGLHPVQPEPAALPGRRLLGQPARAFTTPARPRLPLPRRHDPRRGQAQSADRGEAGAAARPLAPLRRGARRPDARASSSGIVADARGSARTCSSRRRRASVEVLSRAGQLLPTQAATCSATWLAAWLSAGATAAGVASATGTRASKRLVTMPPLRRAGHRRVVDDHHLHQPASDRARTSRAVPVIRVPGSWLYWLGSSTTRPVRTAIVSPSSAAEQRRRAVPPRPRRPDTGSWCR